METIEKIIFETDNLKNTKDLCLYAMTDHTINVLTSNPGNGKTVSLDFVSNTFSENVIRVSVYKSTNPRIFYSDILNMFIDEKFDQNIPLNILIKRVANQFVSKNKNMLLIIDEATKFEHNFFEHLQDFWELTKGNTGIVLGGGHYFKKKFMDWNENAENGMPEFYSRIDDWVKLNPPRKDEIVSIIEGYDIFDNKFVKSCFDVESFRDLVDGRIRKYLRKKGIRLIPKA